MLKLFGTKIHNSFWNHTHGLLLLNLVFITLLVLYGSYWNNATCFLQLTVDGYEIRLVTKDDGFEKAAVVQQIFRIMSFTFFFTFNCFLHWSTVSCVFFCDMLSCVNGKLFLFACIAETDVLFIRSCIDQQISYINQLGLGPKFRRPHFWSSKSQRLQLN